MHRKTTTSPEDIESLPPEVETLLSSVKVRDREKAISALQGRHDTAALSALHALAIKDENPNIRKSAIQAVAGIGGDKAAETLLLCLEKHKDFFLLTEAVKGLGSARYPAAVSPVAELLINKPDRKIAYACLDCLFAINPDDLGKTLDHIIEQDPPDFVIGYMLKLMGETKDNQYAKRVAPFIAPNVDTRVRLAALTALSNLSFNTFASSIEKTAMTDGSLKIRQRTARLLGKESTSKSIRILWQQLCLDQSMIVKEEAMHSLEKFNAFEQKYQGLMELIHKVKPTRASLESEWIVRALLNVNSDTEPQKPQIARKLVQAAAGADKSVNAVMAALLIAVADRNLARAGTYIDQIQEQQRIDPGKLASLRVDVGGQHALNPLFEKLEGDLKTYFQDPIHDLNEQTKTEWQSTIAAARIGYLVRMSMGCIVFLVGMVLLTVSFYLYITNQLSGNQLWGTGVSFVSGLGSMILVIYTGPLKDIRGAVSDMGASNAAFIAYIHRILQISHTFSAYYLNQNITFEDTRASCSLIDQAMVSTVSKLEFERNEPGKDAE